MIRRRHPARRTAFTLIETVATILVLSVLGTAASLIILTAVDGYMDSAAAAEVHVDASIALDRIARELRKIELDAGAAGIAPNIDTVTASSINWSDSDADAYSVSLSGTDLMLAIDGGAAAVLLQDVSSFTVQTYDESNTALAASLSGAQCDPIRRVELQITVARDGASESVRSRVFVRSTMTGGGTA